MSKQLLLDQLNALADTMKLAAEADAVLNMESFVKKAPTQEIDHFCGTAACICGYQAIAGDLRPFNLEKVSNLNESRLTDLADSVVDMLEESCEGLFGIDYLSTSIWAVDNYSRWESASKSALFSVEELYSLVHLNSDSSTAQDAYDYLVVCIKKVEEYGLN